MIVIEIFYKPNDDHQYLRFQYDDLEDLFLLDSLLVDKYRIVERDKNSVSAVFEMKGE